MTTPQTLLRRQATLEALRNQQHNLEQTIADLLELLKTMPEGEARGRHFDQISCLDSIADVIRQALKS